MPNRKCNKTFWEQLTSWPKRSSSKSREQAASRYCDSKAWSWGRQARTTIWQKQKIKKVKWSNGRQEQLTSESTREPPLQVCSLGSHTKASSILEARAPLHKARNSLALKRCSFFFFLMSSWMMRRSFVYFSAASKSSLAASAPVSLNMTASVCTTRVLRLRVWVGEGREWKTSWQSHDKSEKSSTFLLLKQEFNGD